MYLPRMSDDRSSTPRQTLPALAMTPPVSVLPRLSAASYQVRHSNSLGRSGRGAWVGADEAAAAGQNEEVGFRVAGRVQGAVAGKQALDQFLPALGTDVLGEQIQGGCSF